MNANDAMIWVQVGESSFRIASAGIEAITKALKAADIDTDNAQLDRINALYAERIARAEAESST